MSDNSSPVSPVTLASQSSSVNTPSTSLMTTTGAMSPIRDTPPDSPSGGADLCSICLDTLQNLAVCDPCFHSFCYPCINAWSRVNNICPLCKSTFDKIHYEIKSNRDFKIQNVPPVNRLLGDDFPPIIAPTISTHPEMRGPFPFMTVFGNRRQATTSQLHNNYSIEPSSNESANLRSALNSQPSAHFISSLDSTGGSVRITTHRGGGVLSHHPNISISVGSFGNGHTVVGGPTPVVVPLNSSPASSTASYSGRTSTISQSIYDAINRVGAGSSEAATIDLTDSSTPDMLRGISPSNRSLLNIQGRRLIYHHGFKVRHYNSRLTRDISLSFMQQRQASVTRIMQWANRELRVLVDNRELSSTLGSLMRLLRTVDIDSREFYTGLVGKLGSRTAHFIHELKSFARSPFAVEEYDRHAMYGVQGNEKIAIEITNEDIENWSLDEIQMISSSSTLPLPSSSNINSKLLNDKATTSSSSPTSSSSNFAPATSSSTCARLARASSSNSNPPLLVILSDDEDHSTTRRLPSSNMVATTSTGMNHQSSSTSHSVHTSSSRRSKSSKQRYNRSSSSTYSARVISSDDYESDHEMDLDFANRIQTVTNTSNDVTRHRSPIRSGKTRTRHGRQSSANRSTHTVGDSREKFTSTSEANVLLGPSPSDVSASHNSSSLKLEPKIEPIVNSEFSSVLTLDSSIREVSLEPEPINEDKPVLMNSVVARANVTTVVKDEEMNSANLMAVSSQLKTESKMDVTEPTAEPSQKTEVKTSLEGTSRLRVCPSGAKDEDSVVQDEELLQQPHNIISMTNSSAMSSSVTGGRSSFDQGQSNEDIDTGVVTIEQSTTSNEINGAVSSSLANNSSTGDDVLALTDDLRPKAVVPDMSDPAAAEVNVATSADLPPIEVSESEEDAIVFIRQQIFTPPLIDLDTDTEQQRPDAEADNGRETSNDDDESGATKPKLLRYYSSTSSEESTRGERLNSYKVRRRSKRKKRHRQDFLKLQKRSNSDIPTSLNFTSPPKKARLSSMGSIGERTSFSDDNFALMHQSPAILGNFLGESSQPFMDDTSSNDQHLMLNSVTGNVMHVAPGANTSGGDTIQHPLSSILGYNADRSSDSEIFDEDPFSSNSRYHPYI